MKKRKVEKIDYSAERLGLQADKYYNEGKLFAALRFAYRQYELYGGDAETFARLADIYESMGLYSSAINWYYRFLDIAQDEDLPEIYEGLAVNYLNMGNETQSAYYYNLLMEEDDTLPDATKIEIINAFSREKRANFRFVYPPELADYSREVELGSRALKVGDCKRAIGVLSTVPKGAKEYVAAQEMQAVAYLLSGEPQKAEAVCKDILEEKPDEIRAQATLAAAYTEQGRKEESLALALRLAALEQLAADDLYKVATVCCENGLHEKAYEKFEQLTQKTPYDGRTLYFKGVSAYKCGKRKEAEAAFDALCTVYPDAEVAKYYLREWRACEGTEQTPAEPDYFYHLPQEEREARCRSLIHMGKCPKDEAQLFGLLALHDGYFRWCFDEMDGADHDLQYLALVTAEHVRADGFIREALLDCEVLDVLKVETLRLLYERNEDELFGVVLCHTYRHVDMMSIKIGRKKRKRFIEAYAKTASKFVIVNGEYAEILHEAAEELYRALEANGGLDLIEKDDDCACAIFLTAGLKELGKDLNEVARAFDADAEKVRAILEVAAIEEREYDEDYEDEEFGLD